MMDFHLLKRATRTLSQSLFLLTLSASLVFLTAEFTHAAVGPHEQSDDRPDGRPHIDIPEVPAASAETPTQTSPVLRIAFNDAFTAQVVQNIENGARICRGIAAQYRTDCLAQALKSGSDAAYRPDYSGARSELRNGSWKLSNLVTQNEDKSAPKLRRGGRTFRAVKKSAVRKVNRAARKIIVETETRLLRSAGNAKLRKTHYGRIARAVGSTKNILRSGLLQDIDAA